MWTKLLRSTGWKQLGAFVSPALMDVVSVRDLVRRAHSVRTSRHDSRYREAVATRARTLRDLPLSIRLPEADTKPGADELGEGPQADGERLVTLYFHQLFSEGPTLVDLRGPAFRTGESSVLDWQPAGWVCAWDDDFLDALRNIYSGFYRGDDARFDEGLRALDLESASDLFLQHFGGDQRQQTFAMPDFVDTFHQVFVRCRDHGVRLHADFLPLGAYLAALYDHLDGTSVSVNVRSCFERAVGGEAAGQGRAEEAAQTHG